MDCWEFEEKFVGVMGDFSNGSDDRGVGRGDRVGGWLL